MKVFQILRALALGAAMATSHAASAEELKKVDLALAGGSLIAAIPLITRDLGFFEDHGIDPNFVTMDSSSAAATALLSGAVSFAFSGPGSLVAAQARGQDMIVVNSTYRGLGGTLILSKGAVERIGVAADAPIEERLRALNGLVIATPSPTSSYTIAFREAAAAQNAQINFTFMAIPTMPAAFSSGAVDGYVASAPYWLPPIIDGTGVQWISGPQGQLPAKFAPAHTAVTLAMRAYTDANPDIVDRVNAALQDFIVAIDERPDDIKKAIRANFPDLDQKTLDLLFESERAAWRAGAVTPEEVRHEVEVAVGTNTQIPASVLDIDPARMVYR
jgi:ABC-type nitrate/sulfonate/bicarbonate transport system substrate-binding protein